MADTLSQAKATLEHANKAFPSPHSTAPSHDYSNTPYSMINTMKKKLSEPFEETKKAISGVEEKGIAQGVENRQKQLKDAGN